MDKNQIAGNKKEPNYRGIKAMPFVIGNETFEKLGTIGTSSNLLVYLTTVFNMKSITATNVLNVFNGTCQVGALFGAFISDTYLGRYKTTGIASISSFQKTAQIPSPSETQKSPPLQTPDRTQNSISMAAGNAETPSPNKSETPGTLAVLSAESTFRRLQLLAAPLVIVCVKVVEGAGSGMVNWDMGLYCIN